MIDSYYDFENNVLKNKLGIKSQKELKNAESDIVSLKIRKIDLEDKCEFSVDYLNYIHHELFSEIYEFAGKYRTIDIVKPEYILGGLSINYCDYNNIEQELNSIIKTYNNVDIKNLSKNEQIEYITNLLIDLWKIHPYREGNTRTVIIFIQKTMDKNGIKHNRDIFIDNASYIRSSLVAASFEDTELSIKPNKEYIKDVIKEIIVE